MKQSGYKSVFHILIIFIVLLAGAILVGFGMILYYITIQKPDGHMEISKWPIDFTQDFSKYITLVDSTPEITEDGQLLLEKNKLWIQVIDTNGDEIHVFNKPKDISTHYSATDILNTYTNGIGDYSVFFGSINTGDKEWTYLIGFPVSISKVTIYVNQNRFTTFRPVVRILFGVVLGLLILSCFVYSFIVMKKMKQIRKAIKQIASRTYMETSCSGSFSDVYEELNDLNLEMKKNDEARERDEKLREEWIANITHDLKTPLSPIRGYAELITTQDIREKEDELREYGCIILKNTAYAEELINDLKLTYQLKNGMIPLNMVRRNLVRFIKEIVIDILNNPVYVTRSISFTATDQDVEFLFDAGLLRRAFTNLLLNALIHNNNDTQVDVTVSMENNIQFTIQDNGKGMDKDELDNLFIRYYSGKNTSVKTSGTGLGMAIAKQIIDLHGGSINVESQLGYGTCIMISFPLTS